MISKKGKTGNKTDLPEARYLTLTGLICGVFVALMLVSCTPTQEPLPPPPADEQSAAEDVIHVIHYQGETLGIISKWYTGKTENWNLLLGANPGLQPTRMRLGQSIHVPGQLVVNRQPLPESVVKKAISQVSSKETEQERPALLPADGDMGIGPIETTAPEKKSGGSPADLNEEKPVIRQPPLDEAVKPPAEQTIPVKQGADVGMPGVREDGKSQSTPKAQTAPKPSTDQDAERERLLDELLSQ
jgi:hypothetical protein